MDGIGALHELLTGWFIDDDLDRLAAVDAVCLAIERGSFDRYRLEVQLDIEVDEVGGAPESDTPTTR